MFRKRRGGGAAVLAVFLTLLVHAAGTTSCARPARTAGAPGLAAALNPFFGPYKRALFLSGQPDAEGAAASLDSARTAFAELSAHPPDAFGKDGGWPARRRAMGDSLAEAGRLLKAGEAAAAHRVLEPVRYQLREQNDAVGYTGWPDMLLTFHDPMEDLVRAPDVESMEDQVAGVREALEDLRAYRDPRWSPLEWQRTGTMVDSLAAAVGSVASALRDDAPLSEVRPRALALQRIFVRLYLKSSY